ncbi:S8 family peptidase [Streptomyces sp. NPDC005438]|uniref:S8 family peptidase n=1 Tax=Streptomyces sp. NPDC005438 TaxID=3156880 RepID=UPI0033A4D952
MARSRKLNRRTFAAAVATAVAVSGGVALASPAGAAPTEGKVYGATSAQAVKGNFVVLLDGKKERADRSAKKDLARKYGGNLSRNFSSINGFSAKGLTLKEARRLAGDPSVAKVVQSKRVKALETQDSPPSWGLDRIDQADLPLDDQFSYPDTSGEGVTAYVIDTGVRVTHDEFGDRGAHGYDAVDGDEDASDEHGHGTHVAGTLAGETYGVAKKANVVGVRVLDANGSGTTEQVVAGIDWVTKNHEGPSVANLSLGGGVDEAIDSAVREAVDSGVTVAVAAGNSSADASQFSPARVEEALTVAASDDSDAQAYFSNYGSVVDLYAPGVDILSASHTADDATQTYSGTSQATPHVAGAAALFLGAHPDASPADVADALDESAAADKISDPGEGTPNKLLQVGEE